MEPTRRPPPRSTSRTRRAVRVVMALLLIIVVASVTKRLVIDVPHLVAGTLPSERFDRRYVTHPWSTWVHIAPGALYLLLAPLQLARGFRSRHRTVHRRLGRVLTAMGLLSGASALVIGIWFPFGNAVESVASVVFGSWFLICLVLGVRAVRGGDVTNHRRWMIRAFAVSLGIGTVRVWLALFQAVGLGFSASFGPAFWIAFSLHVLVGEVWLRARSTPASPRTTPPGRPMLPGASTVRSGPPVRAVHGEVQR